MSGDAGSRRPTARGQSNIDFVIGFGVFFVTFSFVVALIPELLAPFGAQQGPAVADRAADALAGDLLASEAVGGLNATCTAEFFNATDEPGCGFDGGDSTTTLLGLSGTDRLNVTLRDVTAGDGRSIACYEGTEVVTCSSGADRLARGNPPPGDTQSVRSARRVVELDDETLLLEVRVW